MEGEEDRDREGKENQKINKDSNWLNEEKREAWLGLKN